jgi:hypothetical protein
MIKSAVAMAVLVWLPLVFGQLDTNSVTVTASRTPDLQPDEAIFGVFVDSDLHATLSDILAVLPGSGIAISNFVAVNTVQRYSQNMPLPSMLEWGFRLPVALSKMKETVATLTAMQQSLVQKNNGFVLSFNLQGTQVSQQLQQSQSCLFPDLMADARASAQRLASGAGLSVGNVLAMSSQTAPSNCSVTVKFALGRF